MATRGQDAPALPRPVKIHPQALLDMYPPRRYAAESVDYFARLAAAGSGPGPNAAAIDTLFRGLVAAGLWPQLGAACLLAGPASLAGALVPIRADMPAPTAFNFVSGDYSRVEGLKGDGAAKSISTGRAGNADAQNDRHLAVWVAQDGGQNVAAAWLGLNAASGVSQLGHNGVGEYFGRLANSPSAYAAAPGAKALGFAGVARANGADLALRASGATITQAVASQAPSSATVLVYSRSIGALSADRLAWYSVGAALDLAALDAALSAYVAALR